MICEVTYGFSVICARLFPGKNFTSTTPWDATSVSKWSEVFIKSFYCQRSRTVCSPRNPNWRSEMPIFAGCESWLKKPMAIEPSSRCLA